MESAGVTAECQIRYAPPRRTPGRGISTSIHQDLPGVRFGGRTARTGPDLVETRAGGGIELAVKNALQQSGKMLPWQVVTLAVDGTILED